MSVSSISKAHIGEYNRLKSQCKQINVHMLVFSLVKPFPVTWTEPGKSADFESRRAL